jgi:hypothetical protein
MNCGECGSKNVSIKNVKGRAFPYKQYESIVLTEDLELLTCNDCSNYMIKSNDCKLLDIALEASLQSKFEKIKDCKCHSCGCRDFSYKNMKGNSFDQLGSSTTLNIDLLLFDCNNCHEIFLVDDDKEKLEMALEQSVFLDCFGQEQSDKCPYCSGPTSEEIFEYTSNEFDCETGNKIIVSNAKYTQCLNKECNHNSMNTEQSNFISKEVLKRSRFRLKGLEVSKILDKININRGELSKLLFLEEGDLLRAANDVKFLPDSVDLLLRLIHDDPKLVDKIKQMHNEKFKVDLK